MSDEQPTSWRDRFFGSASAKEPTTGDTGAEAVEPSTSERQVHHHSADDAPDDAEVAATSVSEHDEHQPLVEHEPGTDTAPLDTAVADDRGDSPIEPTVIAPSTLRGPSHSAAAPDDMARTDAHEAHGDAAASSLEQQPELAPHEPEGPRDAAADGDDASRDAGDGPPPLVEPRRPSFGLRRHTAGTDAGAAGDVGGDGTPDGDLAPDADRGHAGALAAGGVAAAGAAGAAAASRDGRSDRDFVEPEPTQAMDAQHHDDQATRAIDTHDADGDTRVLEQQPGADERTQRFGIVRDEVPASAIAVDEETARAASGGTPIVLVEEPVPPRRKGARGVGFAVALLATAIFALVFAAAFFAVGYLFDRGFDAAETLETVWLRPSFLLPVIVFFLAYWLVTLVVNRAGWWAHVLGAFLVALLVYAAHIGGAYMEAEGGWESYTALPGIDAEELGQLILAPLSVLAFVIAREVPVWVGGIVSRRGRRAREWNRQAMDDFNAENAERLAAYERARS
ncbi:hypothetical protein ACIQC8_09585 [Agrococcus sediminis]|uniref:hypothetical protein n=1 Tax=Agrococcus sediminis TaxID=2599924 RepID=UPI0038007C97